MPDPNRERRLGLLFALATLAIWVGFQLTGRLSAKQAFTPWDVAAVRYAGSFLCALAVIAVTGLPRLGLRRGVVAVATAGFGFPILAYVGFQYAPVAHGGVMTPGTLPFLTAALATIFLDEPWDRRRLLSLVVVAAGIGLLASDTLGGHPGAWRGDLLFLAASLSWAAFTVCLRAWRIPALDASVAVALWPAPFFLPVWWLALPSNLHAVPWGAIAFQFVWQGMIAVLLAGFLFARAVALIGTASVTTITAAVPVLAALAAWPLLDEPLGTAGLLGAALVSVGIVLGVAGSPRPAAVPAVPKGPAT